MKKISLFFANNFIELFFLLLFAGIYLKYYFFIDSIKEGKCVVFDTGKEFSPPLQYRIIKVGNKNVLVDPLGPWRERYPTEINKQRLFISINFEIKKCEETESL
jgi:hypothetical protein